MFACTTQAEVRMAEAFFNRMAKGKAQTYSAGIQPANEANPLVVKAIREIGIDISGQLAKNFSIVFNHLRSIFITLFCDPHIYAKYEPVWELQEQSLLVRFDVPLKIGGGDF